MNNNKGFSVSGILYPAFIIIISLVAISISQLYNYRITYERQIKNTKDEVLDATYEIVLNGGDNISINALQTYVEPGYKVLKNNVEVTIMPNVIIDGQVEAYPGRYELSYYVKGDTAVKKRVVNRSEYNYELILNNPNYKFIQPSEAYVEYSVTVKESGVVIPNPIGLETLGTVNNAIGEYEITYKINPGNKEIKRKIYRMQKITNFVYTGNVQTFTPIATGKYQIELWGASGGDAKYTIDRKGGKGGYTKGTINLTKDNNIYVNVGGKGISVNGTSTINFVSNGNNYNGGGKATGAAGYSCNAGGGGATDVRLTNAENPKFRYVRDYVKGNTVNTGNHWAEIMVYSNNVNIAKNKPVTHNGESVANITLVTNENTYHTPWVEVYKTNVNEHGYVEIDLGQEYSIDYIKVWHYWGDGRTYKSTKTSLLNNGKTIEKTIYNSEISGEYFEDAGGIGFEITNTDNNLNSRIMVAGGGGGATSHSSNVNYSGNGGAGGGINGKDGPSNTNTCYAYGTGATQTKGGVSKACVNDGRRYNAISTFGLSYFSNYTMSNGLTTIGGGGGYYGGGVGLHAPAGGGSSYISGHTGCIAIQNVYPPIPKSGCIEGTTNNSCSIHYSNNVFINTEMKSGDEVMPDPNGGTMTGNANNGYARITFIEN